jgi:hypothetical protein
MLGVGSNLEFKRQGTQRWCITARELGASGYSDEPWGSRSQQRSIPQPLVNVNFIVVLACRDVHAIVP